MNDAFKRWNVAYERAQKAVAAEAGISPNALRSFVQYAKFDGDALVRTGWALMPRAPAGYTALHRKGLVKKGESFRTGPIGWWNADLTPAGRRLLWRYHEAVAAVPHRTDPIWDRP